MPDSNDTRIDTKHILGTVSVRWVFLRGSGYEYEDGQDIDIFCYDRKEMTRQIFHVSSAMLLKGWSIKVSDDSFHSTHIDYIRGDKLILRFDLVDSLDFYKETLLENKNNVQLAMRLLECAKNPQKEKHLKFVKENL